ncbi:MAG: MFS transporter [Chloroflexi bacterium]|nr:MFS transporter [Anaerolineaceae bacterium]NMB86766.1 MFS transporter [Chloroflexota bacterium]
MQTFVRSRYTWLIYIFLAYYGYFLNVYGPITPYLKEELSISYTVSSLHFSAFAAGILAVGLGGYLIIERIGRWRALWAGAFGVGLSVAVLLLGKTPVITIGASFVMGFVGSLILAVVPSALSDEHGEYRSVALSEANLLASILVSTAPLLVGWFVGWIGDWRPALALPALLVIPLYLLLGKVEPIQSRGPEKGRVETSGALPPQYWIYWVVIMLSVSVEFCMIFWSADYIEIALGLPRNDAVQAVSLFLVAMIAGRWAGSRLVVRIPARWLVGVSIIIAAAGFLMYWQPLNVYLGLAGLFIAGLGVASLYPLTLSLAIASAGEKTVQAGARATMASGVAILALPLLLGRLADAIGIQLAYGIVAVLLVTAFGMLQLTRRFKELPA